MVAMVPNTVTVIILPGQARHLHICMHAQTVHGYCSVSLLEIPYFMHAYGKCDRYYGTDAPGKNICPPPYKGIKNHYL